MGWGKQVPNVAEINGATEGVQGTPVADIDKQLAQLMAMENARNQALTAVSVSGLARADSDELATPTVPTLARRDMGKKGPSGSVPPVTSA